MSNSNIFSVSNLVNYIKQQLKSDYLLTNVTVIGEIGNFTNHYSGHWYFSLKDNNALIIALDIVVRIGKNVNEISRQIQNNVASEIYAMTSISNIIVNVNVKGFCI